MKVMLVVDFLDLVIGYYRKSEMEEVKCRFYEMDLMLV